jgi:DNA-binding transcriptional LysR family regulator
MYEELAGLKELAIVAEKRSFTAAAAALRVSPSAVSQSVRGLEERVGVRLLQRTTRSVGLTEAGAGFLARLKPALDGVREAFESLSELRERPAGTLRLTLPRVAYREVLAPRIAEFLALYPDISIEAHFDEAFVDLADAGFDAGVRIGEMVERDMIGVRVSPDLRVAVVASPAYFARRGRPKHPRELHDHECINYRRRSSGAIYAWEFTEQGRDFQVSVNGRLVFDDGELLIEAALDGLGVAHVMDCSVHELLAEKRLQRVLEGFCPPFPGFHLYYPSRAQLAPKLQALVDFLKTKPTRARRSSNKPRIEGTL